MNKFFKLLLSCSLLLIAMNMFAQNDPPCDAGNMESLETVVAELAGEISFDTQGSPGNTILNICNSNLAFQAIDSIAWDNITSDFIAVGPFGPSWCSELTFNIGGIVAFSPGVFDDFGGGCGPYTSGGSLSLSANGIPPIMLDGSGCVSIEIFEGFDDISNSADAIINSGRITLSKITCVADPTAVIPTMGEWGLMSLGLLFLIIGIVAVRHTVTSLS